MVGSATVTATTGSIVGTSTLYVVERVLTSIAVTADNATLAHGLSQQYTATGTYSDNTTGTTSISNVTGDVHWTVTGPATITNSGYLTTTGVGAVVVMAHIYDLPIATANLNVTDKELVRIVVTPAEAQVAKGWSQRPLRLPASIRMEAIILKPVHLRSLPGLALIPLTPIT